MSTPVSHLSFCFVRTVAAVGLLTFVQTLSPTHALAQGTIPLTVKCIGTAQTSAPVFTGIPFPLGALTDPNKIDLVSAGTSAPRQVRVISSYPDGSIRVLLLGFRVTLSAGATLNAEIRYGGATGSAISPEMSWARNLNVLALCPPSWYGNSGVFNLRFQPSASNTYFPGFETEMRFEYDRHCDPPSSTNPDNRNYYDHAHALISTLLRDGGPDSAWSRIRNEVTTYRENEILHSGTYRGQYNAGTYAGAQGIPIPIGIIRRMYPQGLLEDYWLSGDQRSLDVAREICDALLADHALSISRWRDTERNAGFMMLGLMGMYEATLDNRFLDAAKFVADVCMDHQDAMALKYPNQGFITGQTGGFIQDRNGAWFDPSESTASGAGSPFMTTLLVEGLIRIYWHTGDARTRQSIINACDWMADAAFDQSTDSIWYVCRATDNSDQVQSLNPMILQMMGFGHQATGQAKYRSIATQALAASDWGNHIKEYNQAMHAAGQGLYLLQNATGTIPLTLADTGGGGGPAPPSITSLSPSSATAGGAAFTLTVTGSGFTSSSVVRWAGTNKTTTFDSATQLRANIAAADIVTAGTASITVANSATDISNAVTFTITAPPAISSLSPSSATAGGAAFTLTLTGSGFTSSSVVRWNGSDRTTTFDSATQLRGSITAADISTAGTASITVANSASSISNAVNFSINTAATYTLTAAPASVNAGENITVTWTAPAGSSATDWIGLYKVGDPETAFGWWRHTGGTATGTFTVAAPSTGGNYEFRYFIDNGYTRKATSNTVAVAGGSQYTLTATPNSVAAGGTVTVNWTAPAGSSTLDWIGLYRTGTGDTAIIAYKYTGGSASGSATFVMPTATGDYEFRYFINNGYVKKATSGTVTVTSATTYSLTASPTSVARGANITVSWTADSDRTATDWIALFKVGAGDQSFGWWSYTNGAASGSFTVTAPNVDGEYEFRYFRQNGYTKKATSNKVTVGAGATSYSLSASPSTVAPGGNVTVTWTAPSGSSARDWIGLYGVGSSNTAFIAYVYTQGAVSGSATFKMPSTRGSYEFRYLLDNGYTSAATSNTVTVN